MNQIFWPSQNIWTLLVVMCFSWWSWIHGLPWPLKVNFSSGQRNLIKIFYWSQKIALTFFWRFSVEVDKLGKTQIWQYSRSIFNVKNHLNLPESYLHLEKWQFRRTFYCDWHFLISSILRWWLIFDGLVLYLFTKYLLQLHLSTFILDQKPTGFLYFFLCIPTWKILQPIIP